MKRIETILGLFLALASVLSAETNSATLPLGPFANMGFRDEESGDQKGGWTDQGRQNDLRLFKPGRYDFEGVTFEIADPEKNLGRSVISLAGKNRAYFPTNAVLGAPPGTHRNIYLLHATSWTPGKRTRIGTIRVVYADDSRDEIAVESGKDVGDWWDPGPLENAPVVWKGENQMAEVGLYLGKFPIQKKEVRSFELVSAVEAVWTIVGFSLSDREVKAPSLSPVVITSNADWAPLTGKVEPLPDTILDLKKQWRREAPAGKDGWVVIKNGRFELEKKPGKILRFFGINLAHSGNIYPGGEVGIFADRMATLGYNAVRISHHDKYFLSPEGGVSSNLDRIDHLFAELKKRGIYITSDIFVSRVIPRGEIPDWPKAPGMKEYKALVHILPSALESWKKFATFFMEHRNPYTGLPYKDDPALYSLSLVNEDSLQFTWNATEETGKLYLEAYRMFRAGKQLPPDEKISDQKSFLEFLAGLHSRTYERMKAHLRGIGVRALLTDANFTAAVFLSFPRNTFDFVDNHGYWDHPSYTERHFQMPARHHMGSVLKRWAELPRIQTPTRIFGKPFVISEYNYSYPNPFRAEGGPIFGAYAALQEWDGVFRWSYAHSRTMAMEDGGISGFDTIVDPINSLSEIMVALLYAREDVKPAQVKLPLLLSTNIFSGKHAYQDSFPTAYSTLGLWGKVGTVVLPADPSSVRGAPLLLGLEASNRLGTAPYFPVNENLRDLLISKKILKKEEWDPEGGTIRSSTGEIFLSSRDRSFVLKTPKSEALVMAKPGRLRAENLEVENQLGSGVFFASAMDGQNLQTSARILLLHLTDVDGTDSRYRDPRKTIHESNGGLPRLVARGEALIKLHSKKPADWEVWGCRLNGERAECLLRSSQQMEISISAATVKNGKAGFLVYELIRK